MDFPSPIPFASLLGMELVRYDDGQAEVACEVRDELANSMGMAHGGVAMTLLDVAMVHAARSADPARRRCVTLEAKTSFLAPGRGRLLAQAQVLSRSASIAFCEATVFDAAGQRVAHGTGTFKYRKETGTP